MGEFPTARLRHRRGYSMASNIKYEEWSLNTHTHTYKSGMHPVGHSCESAVGPLLAADVTAANSGAAQGEKVRPSVLLSCFRIYS